ncbi:MAG: AAA family ATPase, partial [Rickettsiaceae bacterium]|nr:AAA family ATPase [Rickettsiaceae bacterium]
MEYQITNFLDQIFSLDEQRQTECFVDFLKKYENELILVENLSMTRYLEKPYKIKMFFKILPYCKGLKKLAISDNFIEYKDADALFASLSTNIRLEELDVSDNQIFQNNTNTLIASLKKLIHGNRHEIPNNLELFLQNCQRLKVLKINNNNLGSRGIELLLKMISLMPQLEQLHVSKNKLTDQHIKMLSDSLIRLDNFKVLDISYNHISSEGAKHLSELLEKSPQLTSLNIENNDIGDLGIKEISKNISHNKKLTYLNIKANNISCQGFNLLGKKITSLKNLIKLNIASNELTNSVELFKTLASYQNLKYLELSNSGLNEVDVEELVKVFKKLINLETLYINDNNLGDKSIKKIVDVLINFLKIHHLNLVNTGMEQVGTNYMINNLRKFRSLKYLSFNPKYMNKITGELLIVEIMNCPELTSVFCKEHEEKGFILNLSVDKLPENYNNRKEIEKYINKISDNDIYKPTNTINIDKTTELHKKITILQDEVHIYKESKYWEKMLQASNKLLELDPRDDNKAGYYRYKGVALFKLRKKTEALAAYNMAMSYDIYSKKYVKEKAVILTQLQKYDEAKELFEDLHEDDLLLCTSYIEAKMRSSNTYLSENKVTQDILFRLKHSIQSYPLPQNIKKAATEELNSIESLNSDNYEKADKIAYLKNMLNLPWGKYTTQQIDYDDIISFLNKEHLGLQKVKKRMAESLVFVSDSEKPKLPIFCLVGAPGVGKTSIAHSIANAIGRKCVRMPLGGLDDPCIIRGFSRSYRSATPSKVLTLINQAGTWNPVMILDEIDKVAQRGREGDVVGSLLALLDPVQNSKFKDDYFD